MGKKIALNTLYSLVIFLCLIAAYNYGYEQKQYAYFPVAAIIIAIFIVLKIKILKQIKNAQKP